MRLNGRLLPALAVAAAGIAVTIGCLALLGGPDRRPAPDAVAYISGGDLWVRPLPNGDARRLTDDHAAGIPRFSASGRWIVFQHGPPARPDEIGGRVIRADGTRERRLEGTGLAAWSPVSDVLASTLADGSLFIERADGSGRRQLLPGVAGGGTLDRRLGLKWSGDGQWIVYMEQHQDHTSQAGGLSYAGIRAVRADGSDEHELMALALAAGAVRGPIPVPWSASGSASELEVGENTPEPADAAGLPLSLLLSPRDPAETPQSLSMLAYSDFFAVSPAGDRVALVAGVSLVEFPGPGGLGGSRPPPRDAQTGKRIAVLDLDGGALTTLTPPDMVAVSPAWSPDGSAIAYVARRDTGPVDIRQPAGSAEPGRRVWLMDRNGGGQHQLRTDGADCRQERPLWSSDGSSLLFACVDSEQRASLWLAPSSGGKATRLADGLAPWSSQGPDAGLVAGYQGHIDWPLLYDYWSGRS